MMTVNNTSALTMENLERAMSDTEDFFQQIRDLLDSGKRFDEARAEFDVLAIRAAALGIGGLPQEFIRQSQQAFKFAV